jgi:hypothetical protein
MSDLQEFKFIVQPVLLVNDDGHVIGEQAADPIIIYGLEKLREFCESFPDDLKRLNAEQNGG